MKHNIIKGFIDFDRYETIAKWFLPNSSTVSQDGSSQWHKETLTTHKGYIQEYEIEVLVERTGDG